LHLAAVVTRGGWFSSGAAADGVDPITSWIYFGCITGAELT